MQCKASKENDVFKAEFKVNGGEIKESKPSFQYKFEKEFEFTNILKTTVSVNENQVF